MNEASLRLTGNLFVKFKIAHVPDTYLLMVQFDVSSEPSI